MPSRNPNTKLNHKCPQFPKRWLNSLNSKFPVPLDTHVPERSSRRHITRTISQNYKMHFRPFLSPSIHGNICLTWPPSRKQPELTLSICKIEYLITDFWLPCQPGDFPWKPRWHITLEKLRSKTEIDSERTLSFCHVRLLIAADVRCSCADISRGWKVCFHSNISIPNTGDTPGCRFVPRRIIGKHLTVIYRLQQN